MWKDRINTWRIYKCIDKFWSEILEVFLTCYAKSYTIIYFLFSLEIVYYLQVTNTQILLAIAHNFVIST